MNFETLIVDDDEMVVFLHKIAVTESGLTNSPIVAYNGEHALQYIQSHPAVSYLILLDLNMPQMDGWEFLDAVQETDTPIYVVVVTSSVDLRDRKKAENYARVIDYFEKPLSVENCKQIKHQMTALI
jgi:CheY-like chemotaxis protein